MGDAIVERRIHLLTEATRRLAALLADPHPGLFTWMLAVPRAVAELNAILNGERD